MRYKLTKIAKEEGALSAVSVGHTTVGDDLFLFDYRTGNIKPIQNVTEVIPDWQVVVSRGIFHTHNTSLIKEVRIVDNSTIQFDTQTSTYGLSQEEDE